jgi:hypothetical protein
VLLEAIMAQCDVLALEQIERVCADMLALVHGVLPKECIGRKSLRDRLRWTETAGWGVPADLARQRGLFRAPQIDPSTYSRCEEYGRGSPAIRQLVTLGGSGGWRRLVGKAWAWRMNGVRLQVCRSTRPS